MLRTISRYVVIIAITIMAGVGLTMLYTQDYVAEQRLRVTTETATLASAIEQSMNEKILISEGIAAAFEVEPELSLDQFTRIARNLLKGADEVLNLAAAPDLVFRYVFPVDQNRALLGFDLRTRPEFMESVNRVLSTGQTDMDGPFDLVQGGRGFIIRSPVLTQRDRSEMIGIWGVVSLVIDQDLLFVAAGIEEKQKDLAVTVRTENGTLLFGTPDLVEDNPVEVKVTISGVSWVVSATPLNGWAKVAPNVSEIWGMVIAVAIIAMLVMRAFDWAFARSERAETQLMEAIEALDDGFALYDREDRLILCNTRYKELYSASAAAMVPGRRFEEILRYGLDRGQYLEAVGREEEWLKERLDLHRSAELETEQRLENGRWLRVVERKTDSGNTVGFRVDVTKIKEALEEAEAANAAKSDFINTVSHELRTPLTVILGYNSFIRHPEKLPAFKMLTAALGNADMAGAKASLDQYQSDLDRFSRQIDMSAQQLMAMINGILDLAAIEEGTLNLRCEDMNLRPICEAVVEQFSPLAQKKGLDITLEGDACNVLGDPIRIKQILFNLVGNAVKFTSEGNITVRLSTCNGVVCLDVEDTGDGLEPEEQKVVFDRFCQLDSSQARVHGGVGLGLPISRELAELHGGKLDVKSTKGAGSVFSLRLAAHRREDEAAA